MAEKLQDKIDEAWRLASARPGVTLFDGPMCRLESWIAQGDELCLHLSRTSYKHFVGTNLSHPEWAEEFGPTCMANPVGMSTALRTTDGFLMMGQRNSSLMYYPDRVHPFAGALEPKDGADVFDAIARELQEELALERADLLYPSALGIAEDSALRQPELIFRVDCTKSRAQIENAVDAKEHVGAVAIEATPDAIATAVRNLPSLTPIAVASLLMWGRCEFGQAWFEAHADRTK